MKLSAASPLKQLYIQPSAIFAYLAFALKQFGERLVQLVLGSHEVQVWQGRDRHGNMYWRVYDPVTKASDSFSSVNEVRIWLEQRYYQ